MTNIIHTDALKPVRPEVLEMATAVCAGNKAVKGVLFYGSGLWKELAEDTVLDFYLIVDSFKAYGAPVSHRFWGSILPPNVYYTEKQIQGRTMRCKYAVMTYGQFNRACAGFAIAPSVWARFAQPCRLLCPRGKTAQAKLLTALENANSTFHRRTLPLLKAGSHSPETIWTVGLSETYKSELRSEKKGRNTSIYSAAPESFKARTELFSHKFPQVLVPAPSGQYNPLVSQSKRMFAFLNRPFRRYGGKLVTLLRLIKAPLTFDGAVDYIVWKIERHSGQKLEPTKFQRKHPLIGGWPLLFKALKNKMAR